MWSQSRIRTLLRTVGVALLLNLVLISSLGMMLSGCSDIYFDRRETVALGAEDHIATNRVAQMVDPWPRDVGRREIAFDGQKMQGGVERYRTGRALPPVNVTTSSTAYQAAEQAAASTMNAVTPPPFSTPAVPVK
jgi:hypothetical protein